LAAAHKIQASDKPKKITTPTAPKEPEPSITEDQAKLLWSTARSKLNLSDNDVKSVLEQLDIAGTMAIPASQFNQVMHELRLASARKVF
jgi:hypothetical protein